MMFVDLSKAYDTVPHEALFAKMEQVGIRGKTLAFVRALYTSSMISVRMGGYQSEPFRLLRGLRQGCPMSCVLFDIFDNDWLGRPGTIRLSIGVRIPGVPMLEEGLMAGLLFADDLESSSGDLRGICKIARRVDEWCQEWEMSVGIKKCGAMCVGTGKAADTADKLHKELAEWYQDEERQDFLLVLGGDKVPVVEEYVYLGLILTRKMDLDAMVEGRVKKAEKAYRSIKLLLADQSTPVAIRVMVLKAVVSATLLYGSEIWGMSQARVKGAQALINKALRVMAGCKEKDSSLQVAALWREFGVPPVHAEASARRARALVKYPNLKTWIGVLFKYPVTSKTKPWIAKGKAWIKRFVDKDIDETSIPEPGYIGRAKSLYDRTLRTLWGSMEQTHKTAGFYDMWKFADTTWTSLQSIPIEGRSVQIEIGRGLRLLHLCRIKGWWTARKLAKHHLIDDQYKNTCPCCGDGVGETIGHIILKCIRWKKQRQQYLGGLIRAATNIVGVSTKWDSDLVVTERLIIVLILGGTLSCGSRIRHWLPCGEYAGPVYQTNCGIFGIAKFLQSIEVERSRLIPNTQNDSPTRRVDAQRGMAAQASFE